MSSLPISLEKLINFELSLERVSFAVKPASTQFGILKYLGRQIRGFGPDCGLKHSSTIH